MTVTQEDLLAMACAFDVRVYDPHGRSGEINGVRVERRRVNPQAWAIVSGGSVLARDHWWYIDSIPSQRTPEELAETRWPDAVSAIGFAREHLARFPSGYCDDQLALSRSPHSAL